MVNLSVIFDMDGVLFDTERAILACWLEISKSYPVSEELVTDTFLKCCGTNMTQTTEIYNKAFAPFMDQQSRDSLWRESYDLFKKRYAGKPMPLKAGAKEVLEYMKSREMRIGLATSTKEATARQELQDTNLLPYFESVTGGDSVKISKPNPEIYLLACKKMGVSPSETFAVEDSYNGIRAAHAAGMRPIMVPDLVPADSEISGLSEIVCKDLFEVIRFFSVDI